MRQLFNFLFCISLLNISAQNDVTQYVNPFIGTGGHGHTYPGATLPFGMVQLSPDTRLEGWDGCSGYHYSDSVIYGFSHTHLSGTGVPDYCDILLMPMISDKPLNAMQNNKSIAGYPSEFSHANEFASPGFYSVLLDDENIFVELTTTARVGMHRYTFPKSKDAQVILDLTHRDQLLEGSYIKIIAPDKIEGLRRSTGWAADQWVYFAIQFSQPFESVVASSDSMQYAMHFSTSNKKAVVVKCAISAVSTEGAWNNMNVEIPDWDFEKVKSDSKTIWNTELSKIEVSTADINRKKVFYSALYHCMLAPNIYNDADGKYRGHDMQIHTIEGHNYYTVFSLWDTFRALHPLLTIIDQKRTNDFIQTFLFQYQQGGRLPVWELAANETECMIGYHSVSVIADAAVKGIRDYDMQLAYTAMQHSANTNLFGLKYYNDKGFIESNEEGESVSRTLEYAYDDWCIAQMGNIIHGKNGDYWKYFYRSMNYLNLFDGEFIRPRFNGGFLEPFDPREVNFNYTEANAWQYNFFFPHDVMYFTNNLTSKQFLEEKLDSLFTTNSETTGREQSDITGLIGQYAHGNEPSHHVAYLYAYADASYKTEERVRQIMDELYHDAPDGLSGNEDCGQMSAWYVLSAMGFYPVAPGSTKYILGSPVFDSVKVHLENGNDFKITATNYSIENKYVRTAALNAMPITEPQIDHNDIMNGSTLEFDMSATLNKNFGKFADVFMERDFVPAPVFEPTNTSFNGTQIVSIYSLSPETNILFNDTKKDPTPGDQPYYAPFRIDNTVELKAVAYNSIGTFSSVSTAKYKSLDQHKTIEYITEYDPQYTGGGANALIDGLRGAEEFRTGVWQGWWGNDMEVLLDLGDVYSASKVSIGFLQDSKSWILLPTEVTIEISVDGIHFKKFNPIIKKVDANNLIPFTEDYNLKFGTTAIRYIKVLAKSYGELPPTHLGAGGKAWLFCDEIIVE
ncbi:MAG: GH92 family glycosyl hydrolase [Bacteroidetes bacterium]|nr:GH92 family glycosyl hydrolase [Bacteroidota bacterium]